MWNGEARSRSLVKPGRATSVFVISLTTTQFGPFTGPGFLSRIKNPQQHSVVFSGQYQRVISGATTSRTGHFQAPFFPPIPTVLCSRKICNGNAGSLGQGPDPFGVHSI